MGEEGEKTCPLCAEEMDLTDQQLKPCKCGYEICVWCWHHIMEMAEKDDSEGRCPACRTPYNKEKVVGAAAKCGRLVAELNTEKRVRSNKGKSKTSEGRKQLSSVRVIQRNLVYVVGLPLNLADEDQDFCVDDIFLKQLLQHKEYFGQYGKVLKVSISRSTSGAIQHFANNTCSVYITYLKEDEALRCIQSVHGFVLEGRPLRACYGTTKYCHAWLRNVPCSNPDCLYLHETGSQEDSFTKDELISAYTRNRVQQVTCATNSMQRRFGNALPAPADDYCNRTSANSLPGGQKISPPSSSCGRSVALPAVASWGTRPSNSPPTSGSLSSSNGPHKQKLESINGSVTFSAVLASSNPMLLQKKENSLKEKSLLQEESKPTYKFGKERMDDDSQIHASDNPVTLGCQDNASIRRKEHCSSAVENGDECASSPTNISNLDGQLLEACGLGPVEDTKDILNEKINRIRSDVPPINLGRHLGVKEDYSEQCKVSATAVAAEKSEASENGFSALGIRPDGGLVSEASRAEAASLEGKDEVLSFDDQSVKNLRFVSSADHLNKFSNSLPLQSKGKSYPGELNGAVSEDLRIVHKSIDSVSQTSGTPVLLNGYPENYYSSSASLSKKVEHSHSYHRDEKTLNLGRYGNEGISIGCNGATDMGEDSIISNILSLEIDSWDQSLTSPQNLSKFLGETDKHQGPLKVSAPWKVQQSSQSRFSFAREEESVDLVHDPESVTVEQSLRPNSSDHGENLDMFGRRNGFYSSSGEERDFHSSSHFDFSFCKLPVSRPQVSAPPGFLTPSRAAPPPGFAAHERIEQQTFNSPSGNYQIGASSLLRNHYQVPLAGNVVSDGDVEFLDPAILAVGKGRFADGLNSSGLDMRSSFSPQLRAFENDANLQLLMQRSSPQNHRFDVGSSFSSFSDRLRLPSSVMEQSIINNISQFSQVGLPQNSRSPWVSNGPWDTWKEVQAGNNPGVVELLNRERLGFNKFCTGYDDSKLQMPNQGDVYSRPFGI